MNKEHIIAEIQRTATENGGTPLGKGRFEKETGIKWTDWYGKYWARWGDAIQEAGYEPNAMQGAFDDAFVIEAMIVFIRELKRYPTSGEMRMRGRKNPTFPSHGAFSRFGGKAKVASMIVDYCSARRGYDDILSVCRPIAEEEKPDAKPLIDDDNDDDFGHVYLMKSGKHYKIGHSNSAGRREYELALQLPERVETVHIISTDDPAGIESYWHKRFDAKRLNGEWYE